MGDEGDIWKDIRKERQQKRWANHHSSMAILRRNGVSYQLLDESTGHYRLGDYDFWPTTGRFMNRRDGEKGRGVFNLMKELRKAGPEHGAGSRCLVEMCPACFSIDNK